MTFLLSFLSELFLSYILELMCYMEFATEDAPVLTNIK